MRVVHLASRIDDLASGVAVSVPALATEMAGGGHEVSIYTLSPIRDVPSVSVAGFPSWAFPKRLGVSPDLRRALSEAADTGADIVHSHSMWMMPNLYARRRRGGRASFVLSPRGALAEEALARSRVRKSAVWFVGQRRAAFSTDLFHATSKVEVEAIRRAGLPQPVALIPNGVEIPIGQKSSQSRKQSILYFGRIHRHKRIEVLIDAWAQLEADHEHWRLRIVGPVNQPDYLESLHRSVERHGLRRVEFGPAVYGRRRLGEYRSAAVCVLPSASENFGMVVAEALAAGTPVIASKGTPWEGLPIHGCGWWVDSNKASLAEAMEQAMNSSILELDAMGVRGRSWMQEEFSWERAATRLVASYDWILGRGPQPPWVVS